MKLRTIFDSAFEQVDALINLHDRLSPGSPVEKAVRILSTVRPDNESLRQVQELAASHEFKIHVGETSALFRSALVLSVAAVDKVAHEAISKHFMHLMHKGYLDKKFKVEILKSYNIALEARKLRGVGRGIKGRPGNHFKRFVLENTYRKSLADAGELKDLAGALNQGKLFSAYAAGNRFPGIETNWNRIYLRRNHIAHEVDLLRQLKARTVKFQVVSIVGMRRDIELVRRFGQFLADRFETVGRES